MGSLEHPEPITLDYACDRPARRFTPLEKTLVAMLAIMASFVLIVFMRPSFNGDRFSANIDLTRANLGELTAPLERYHQHAGAYPASLANLYRLPSGMTQEAWGGPYVDGPSRLKDAWGREFQYQSPGTHNTQGYDLWSAGSDGQDTTDDDIGNWAESDP